MMDIWSNTYHQQGRECHSYKRCNLGLWYHCRNGKSRDSRYLLFWCFCAIPSVHEWKHQIDLRFLSPAQHQHTILPRYIAWAL